MRLAALRYSQQSNMHARNPELIEAEATCPQSASFPRNPAQSSGGKRISELTHAAARTNPLISVITVVYNGAAQLQSTIESALRLNRDDLEYIVIAGRTARATINLAGKTSLPEFCELVRRAQFLVGNETSAIHIAAAVGTPSICLLGGGHFGRFVPYPSGMPGSSPEPVYEPMPCFGCSWNCHLPHLKGRAVPCVTAINVVAVSAAIEQVLASTARSTTAHHATA